MAQVTGLVAAATVAVVLMLFTSPLQYVPIAALGAVLVIAAFSLVDIQALKSLYRIDRLEFALSIIATLGVVAVGAIHAILIAVILALVRFVRLISRPKVEILGKADDVPGLHAIERHPGAVTIPGLLLFRFNAPIIFFNAPYFKREVMASVDAAGPGLKWLAIDMLPVTMMDATGIYTVEEVQDTLESRGISLVVGGRQKEWHDWSEKRDFKQGAPGARVFPTLRAAVKAYRRECLDPSTEPE